MRRALLQFAAAFGLIAVLSIIAYGRLSDNWVATRPPAPVTEKGFVIKHEQHGGVFYLNENENLLSRVLMGRSLLAVFLQSASSCSPKGEKEPAPRRKEARVDLSLSVPSRNESRSISPSSGVYR
jgi:hypothetical protein